jgi:hypothetical protein
VPTPRHFSALFLVVALAGCDALGEPERFVNAEAQPPTVGALDLGRLQPGQHVAGPVAFTLGLGSLSGRVESVRVFVDGEPAEGVERTSASSFQLDTRAYDEGPHTVAVEVRLADSDLGLLGVVDAPDVVLSAPLVFDQRPPTPVEVTSVAFEDGLRPRVTWTESADANFYAYLVVRQRIDGTYGTEYGEVAVDTVYDRSQTSLLAAPVPDVAGAQAYYHVRVWNRVREARSQSVGVVYGPARSDLRAVAGVAARSADGSRFYVHGSGGVTEVSAVTLEPLRTRLLLGLGPPPLGGARSDLHLDPNTGRLYASTDGPFAILDVETFEEIEPFDMPGETGPFELVDGQIYTVDGGTLYAVDASTGEVTAALEGAFGADHSAVLARSADGRSLHVLDGGEGLYGPAALVRVDLSEAGPRPAETHPLPPLGMNGIGVEAGVAVADNGRVVLLLSQTVTVLDGQDLRPLARFTSERADPEVGSRAVAVRGDRAYAVFYGPAGPYGSGAEVVELDLDGLQPLRRWPFRDAPTGLTFSASGDLVVFGQEHTWTLPL